MFETERPSLVHYAGRFDGFQAVPASVSKTCLVRFDNNKYSVAAEAVGRLVEICTYKLYGMKAAFDEITTAVKRH